METLPNLCGTILQMPTFEERSSTSTDFFERCGISREEWDLLQEEQREAIQKWLTILAATGGMDGEKREREYADEYEQFQEASDVLSDYRAGVEWRKKIAERASFNERIKDDTPIGDIEAITESGAMVKTREDLVAFVEAPLLEACQVLYDKNIYSVMSSANKQDLSDDKSCAYILINGQQLSPENREIAENICRRMSDGHYRLEVPISQLSTVGDVRREAMQLVSQLKQQ